MFYNPRTDSLSKSDKLSMLTLVVLFPFAIRRWLYQETADDSGASYISQFLSLTLYAFMLAAMLRALKAVKGFLFDESNYETVNVSSHNIDINDSDYNFRLRTYALREVSFVENLKLSWEKFTLNLQAYTWPSAFMMFLRDATICFNVLHHRGGAVDVAYKDQRPVAFLEYLLTRKNAGLNDQGSAYTVFTEMGMVDKNHRRMMYFDIIIYLVLCGFQEKIHSDNENAGVLLEWVFTAINPLVYYKFGKLHRTCFYPPLEVNQAYIDQKASIKDNVDDVLLQASRGLTKKGLDRDACYDLFEKNLTVLHDNYSFFQYQESELDTINRIVNRQEAGGNPERHPRRDRIHELGQVEPNNGSMVYRETRGLACYAFFQKGDITKNFSSERDNTVKAIVDAHVKDRAANLKTRDTVCHHHLLA